MSQEEIIKFYENNYELIGKWFLHPGAKKVILGKKNNVVCRFCGNSSPAVTFKKIAHAIPESLGNKMLFSTYECDSCNEAFGQGIENDLGNWTKPIRTFSRIRGKSGVPTLKRTGEKAGWRVEFEESGLNVTTYEDESIARIDEEKKIVTFTVKRDAYTPVGVLKAFIKIGMTLMPAEEMCNFSQLIDWIREHDHTVSFAEKTPIIQTFTPGPMPNNFIAAMVLRRKPHAKDCIYSFLVLSYGNEVFQVPLISPQHDESIRGTDLSLIPFLPNLETEKYGKRKIKALLLDGFEIIRNEEETISMGYDEAKITDV